MTHICPFLLWLCTDFVSWLTQQFFPCFILILSGYFTTRTDNVSCLIMFIFFPRFYMWRFVLRWFWKFSDYRCWRNDDEKNQAYFSWKHTADSTRYYEGGKPERLLYTRMFRYPDSNQKKWIRHKVERKMTNLKFSKNSVLGLDIHTDRWQIRLQDSMLFFLSNKGWRSVLGIL